MSAPAPAPSAAVTAPAPGAVVAARGQEYLAQDKVGPGAFILGSCLVAILFALWQFFQVKRITVVATKDGEGEGGGDEEDDGAPRRSLLGRSRPQDAPIAVTADQCEAMKSIQEEISNGATAFLLTVYKRVLIFVAVFAALIFLLIGLSASGNGKTNGWTRGLFSAIAFIFGGTTSILSGYIGMKVAVFANARTTFACAQGWTPGFNAAFKAGSVMGFALCGLGIAVLQILLFIFDLVPGVRSEGGTLQEKLSSTQVLMETIAGYGLGGSAVALFGRVGGGIYTKAADVGADLVGKVETDMKEDDPKNPACIADNVGDNVGDVAGMGADLFGSLAESSCAALVISAQSEELVRSWQAMMFPLTVSCLGMLVCWLSSYVATHIKKVTGPAGVEQALKWQLMITTVTLTPALLAGACFALPATFTLRDIDGTVIVARNFQAFLCVAAGLWAGLAIGYYTEYMTSNTYRPVRDLAKSCKEGAAVNIIYGLALGQKSCIVPAVALAATIFLSFKMCLMYGVALAALGMLSTLTTGLTIDAYGPISDNAGGIAEMAELDERVRERTDVLDAAGNTTAAIGKGFAIGSAALVSLALFGGFVTSVQFTYLEAGVALKDTGTQSVDMLRPICFAGLLIGAMLPYWFSAMTMKSVAAAAQEMVIEVRKQFDNHRKTLTKPKPDGGAVEAKGHEGEDMWATFKPDSPACINISTRASLREMIAPGALVLLSPILGGLLLGVKFVMGLLAGSLVSGVQMAISSSNSGGAWDNAKKQVESEKPKAPEQGTRPGSGEPFGESDVAFEARQAQWQADFEKWKPVKDAAVIGDTVGDPLKDTSGPSLNILMKLMAIVSLVFAPVFVKFSLAQFYGDLQYRVG